MLPATTSAIGPIAAPRAPWPSRSRRTTSSSGQSCTPASFGEAREGAYQPCMGICPPLKSGLFAVAPSALRGAWQAMQWPRPSVRYAPRFHSAGCVVSGRKGSGEKNRLRQATSAACVSYGKRSVCVRLGSRTGGRLSRNACSASLSSRVTRA